MHNSSPQAQTGKDFDENIQTLKILTMFFRISLDKSLTSSLAAVVANQLKLFKTAGSWALYFVFKKEAGTLYFVFLKGQEARGK